MRKKSIAVTLVFTLVFSVLIGMAPAMAASGDITVTPLISDSADVHYFQVSNTSGEGLDIKWNTSLNTSVANTDYVPAGGSITLTCSDPAMGGLTLYVVYPGGQTSQMSASKYGVDVVYQDEEGNVLMSDTTTSSLGSGVSYSAQSYLELSSGEYDLISNSYQEYAYQSNIQTITFTYRKRVPQPYSCSVIFADTNGVQIGTSSFTVEPGTSAAYTPPAQITGTNNRTYNLVAGQGQISHDYDAGASQYVFRYQIVQQTSNAPYMIRVQYQDKATGVLLSSQSVTVQSGGTATFDVAGQFVTTQGVRYTRAAGEPSTISHAFSNAQRVYTVYFDKEASTEPYDITIEYADAYTGKVLKTNTAHVGINETARFSADASFSAGGKEYILASGQSREVSHKFGADQRVYRVFYNEKGAGAVESYPVSVRYFSITDNSVLYSTQMTANIGENLEIRVPASYRAGGKEYVLLSGQGDVSHEFYNIRHTYVFFYRDVNDVQNEGTVVTPVAGGGATVVTPGNVTATVAPDGTLTVTTPTGETLVLGQNDELVPLAENEKENIEDEQTPLAGKQDQQNHGMVWWIVGGSILVLLIAGAIAFFLIKKRRSRA